MRLSLSPGPGVNEFRREVRRKMWTFVKLRIDAELYEKAAPSRQNTKKINDFIICFKLDSVFLSVCPYFDKIVR